MKRLDRFLNAAMGIILGVLIGTTISQYMRFRRYPQLYAARSGPWYLYDGVIPNFGLFVAVTVVCLLIKRGIKKKEQAKRMERAENEKE